MLETQGLTRRFGGVVAVNDVSMSVAKGSLHGLIGPNGAGKSTLFALVTGHLAPNGGRVLFGGDDITGLPPDARARRGIAIAFQSVRLFRGMTVLENVMVGAQAWTRHGFAEAFLRLPRHLAEERQIRRAAGEALDRLGQGHLAGRPADELPLGQQRAAQIARALCGRPQLLLLDEPASGLRAGERQQLAGLLRSLRDEGLTMLLVEHDVAFVTDLAQTITVLDAGRVIAQGEPAGIRRDPVVIAAYLGQERREVESA